MPNLDTFADSYVECALWSSTDDDGEPLDRNYAAEDIHPDSLARMVADCRRFSSENAEDIATWDEYIAGHDFWLTRNGHGAGFWDGDWEPEAGDRLTRAAEAFGECTLYVGDDGMLHLFDG